MADFTDLQTLNEERLEELSMLEVEGEPSLIVELIDDFLGSAPSALALLADALGSGELESARRIAHALKGSSQNIGADRLGALCSVIENDSNVESSYDPTRMLDEISSELERATHALGLARARRL